MAGWQQAARRIAVATEQNLNWRLVAAILIRAGVAEGAIVRLAADDVPARLLLGPAPDLLILDADWLGGQDPAGVVEAVRAREASAARPAVPVAVVSADRRDETRLRVLAAGADLFLDKPVDGTLVVAAVRALLTRVERPLRRILVVDDQTLNLRLAAMFLAHAAPGVAVELENDPGDGLERCAGDPPVDLLIVNGYMPGLSGPDLIRRLRASEASAAGPRLPVIIESAAPSYLEQGLEAGADLALVQPWSAVSLAMAVRALFPGEPVSIAPATTRRP